MGVTGSQEGRCLFKSPLNTYRRGASTNSLGSQFQYFITLTVKKIFLISSFSLLWSSFVPFPEILWLATPCLFPPVRSCREQWGHSLSYVSVYAPVMLPLHMAMDWAMIIFYKTEDKMISNVEAIRQVVQFNLQDQTSSILCLCCSVIYCLIETFGMP